MSIGVVVLSYNRPELLRLALRSCREAQEIVVMDDGSPFDVREVCREEWAVANVYCGRYRTPDEHLVEPNFGAFLNAGTELLRTDYVAYLCDDDMLAEGWLTRVQEYLKECFCVVGEVVASNGRSFPSLSEGNLCVGNFAVRRGEAPPFDNETWSPENQFRRDLISAGLKITKVDDVALLALQHPNNLSNYRELGNARDYYH